MRATFMKIWCICNHEAFVRLPNSNSKLIMNSFIYFPLFGAMGLLSCFPSQAQEKLSDDAKKEAIDWVKQVKASYLNDSSARIRRAEAALLAACASETAAMNLYVEAMKHHFLNMSASSMVSRMFSGGRGGMWMMGARSLGGGRGGSSSSGSQSPSAMFSSWRKENTGGNAKPGLRKSLQLQFKWMLLCIKKSEAEKREQELDVRGSAMSILDEYIANAKDVSESMGIAASSTGVVKEYLDIVDMRPEKMPDNLSNISGIFEQIFCAPCKENRDVDGLRKIWQKRIASESAILTALNTSNKDAKKSATDVISFTLKRQVDRESECYEIGDEVRAIDNLKKIIVVMREPDDKRAAINTMETMLNGKKVEQSRRRR